jgi:RNA polymerase sigma-70 factor (ECF subfamily)
VTGPLDLAQDSDQLLVGAAQRGDADAFAALVAKHRPWLVGLCRSQLSGDHHAAEDIAQECLVRLHSTLVHCPDRDLSVRPWLSVVARHACIDHHRRQRRHPEPVETLPEVSAASVTDEDIFDVDPALAKAWSRLTPRHREALHHRELIGLSYDDIATLMQTSSAGVESLLVRARAALRREYRRAGGRLLGCGAFLFLERSVRGSNPRPEAVAHVAHCRTCASMLGEIERMASLLRGVPLPSVPPVLPRTPWAVLADAASRLGERLAPLAPLSSDLSHLAVAAGAALAIVAPIATSAPPPVRPLPATQQPARPDLPAAVNRHTDTGPSATQLFTPATPAAQPSWPAGPAASPRPRWKPAAGWPTPQPWYSPQPQPSDSPAPWQPLDWPTASPQAWPGPSPGWSGLANAAP